MEYPAKDLGIGSWHLRLVLFASPNSFKRMKQVGCYMTSLESAVFQMMETAEFPNFKAISSLFKVKSPPSGIEQPLNKL